MAPHSGSLVPALLVPFLAWRIYRRFHRNVGRQPLHRRRLITGIVVFGLISVALLGLGYISMRLPTSYAAGLALGVPLAWWGLKLTRFETDAAGRHFFTPNTYIGVALTLLLTGRVIYRIGVLFFSGDSLQASTPSLMASPLTLFIIGLTAGYYITYNGGVLIKGGRPTP